MIQSIEKRKTGRKKGEVVPFNIEKIELAIEKAVGDTKIEKDSIDIKSIAGKVKRRLNKLEKEIVPVEDVQDIVEKVLIRENQSEVAKAYILYREERSRVRDSQSRLMREISEITYTEAEASDKKKENANIDGNTAMGQMLQYGSAISEEFAKNFVIKPEHSYAHANGDIHIHDRNFVNMGTLTCIQIDLEKLFKDGFSTGHGFLREPNDIMSYSALAAIAVQANQNDQHGGQSIPAFDHYLAPGVIKTYRKKMKDNLKKYIEISAPSKADRLDEIAETILSELGDISSMEFSKKQYIDFVEIVDRYVFESEICSDKSKSLVNFVTRHSLQETEKQTFQAMEALIHNLNTMHSRAGAQVPFSSINFGTDTTMAGRMVSRNLLLAQEAGLGNGETAIFPITIFKVKDGVNFKEGDPNYDLFKLACRVSSKRLFPNFSFLDAPFNLQYYKEGNFDTEAAYMGCRTRVMGNICGEEIATGRGNISFTSLNLPRLGIKHGIALGEREEADIESFYKELDEKIDIIVDQLLERYQIQSNKKVKNFPFLMGQNVWMDSDDLGSEDKLGSVTKHGSLTVGFIGLAETLKALTGFHHAENENAQKLGLEIIGHIRERMDQETKRRKLNFALIATPAEGLSGRFTKIDKELYGEIKGVTDREYYTNSFHVPVYYNIRAIDKIKIEAPYHELTNGGHISYVELDGAASKNVEAFEKIVKVMAKSGIGYGSINHPVDRDPVCGYTGIIGDVCPKCQREEGDVKFERIRRITGYLVGTVDRFNNGKKSEEKDRVKHGISDK